MGTLFKNLTNNIPSACWDSTWPYLQVHTYLTSHCLQWTASPRRTVFPAWTILSQSDVLAFFAAGALPLLFGVQSGSSLQTESFSSANWKSQAVSVECSFPLREIRVLCTAEGLTFNCYIVEAIKSLALSGSPQQYTELPFLCQWKNEINPFLKTSVTRKILSVGVSSHVIVLICLLWCHDIT